MPIGSAATAIARWLSALPHAANSGDIYAALPDASGVAPARVAALIAAGFGLTLLVFYPGVMTFDAKYVYEDIAKGVLRRLAVAGDDRAVEV